MKEDPDEFLIDGEYLTKKINIRSIFYSAILVLALLIISVSMLQFSVNIKLDAKLLPVTYDQNNRFMDSAFKEKLLPDNLIEIRISRTLLDVFEKEQAVEVEITNGIIAVYKNKGEIIQYIDDKNQNEQGELDAIIAREIRNGQILFFPGSFSQNLNAKVNVINVQLKLADLLNLMTDHELKIVNINFFIKNEKNRIQTA